jgi:hypothetical protein
VDIVDSSALTVKPRETVASSPQPSYSHSTSSGSSSSSASSGEGESQTNAEKYAAAARTSPRVPTVNEELEGSSSQFESDAFFVSQEDC